VKYEAIVPDKDLESIKPKGGTASMKSKIAAAGIEVGQFEATEFERTQPRLSKGPSPEEIQLRAYELFVENGCEHGRDRDDWLQAERELQEKYRTS
jgi:hypothetical protein